MQGVNRFQTAQDQIYVDLDQPMKNLTMIEFETFLANVREMSHRTPVCLITRDPALAEDVRAIFS